MVDLMNLITRPCGYILSYSDVRMLPATGITILSFNEGYMGEWIYPEERECKRCILYIKTSAFIQGRNLRL